MLNINLGFLNKQVAVSESALNSRVLVIRIPKIRYP